MNVQAKKLSKQKSLPSVLQKAIERINEWSSVSWKWLHSLRYALCNRIRAGKRSSNRRIRSDQRHAITALLKIIIEHLDLATLKVGVLHVQTNTFNHLTIEYFARKSGLSYRRTQRAMAWLYEAGYITYSKQFEIGSTEEGIIYLPSIRSVNYSLFNDLNIFDYSLEEARKRAVSRINADSIKRKIQKSAFFQKVSSSVHINKQPKKLESDPGVLSETRNNKIKKLMDQLPHLSWHQAARIIPQ